MAGRQSVATLKERATPRENLLASTLRAGVRCPSPGVAHSLSVFNTHHVARALGEGQRPDGAALRKSLTGPRWDAKGLRPLGPRSESISTRLWERSAGTIKKKSMPSAKRARVYCSAAGGGLGNACAVAHLVPRGNQLAWPGGNQGGRQPPLKRPHQLPLASRPARNQRVRSADGILHLKPRSPLSRAPASEQGPGAQPQKDASERACQIPNSTPGTDYASASNSSAS